MISYRLSESATGRDRRERVQKIFFNLHSLYLSDKFVFSFWAKGKGESKG